jgi:hypothetical protein
MQAKISLRLRPPGDRRMRRALLAYLLCDLTEFASWMAVMLVAYARGGAVAVGAASVAMLLPALVIVPLIAGFGDRMPRGRALSLVYVSVAVASLFMCLLLLVEAPFWSVLLGGAIQTIAISLVQPMHYSALPFLSLRPGDLVAANGLSSLMDGMSLFIGFLMAGILADVVGPWVVLLACVGMGLGAALLTTGLGIPQASQAMQATGDDDDEPGELRAAIEGFVALRGNWGAVALLLLIFCMFLVDGVNEPLTLTFNAEVLGLQESTAGLMAGAYGIGLAVGGGMQAGLAHRRRLGPVVLAGTVVLGGFWIAVAFVGSLVPAVVLLAFAGIGASLVVVSARTLLQRTTDNHVLARVLAVQEGVKLSGLVVGAFLGPLAVVAFGPRGAFIPVGIVVILSGLVTFAAVRALESSGTVRLREVEVLSTIPFLAALPAYELEHLAQTALWREAPSGAVVVAQGEPGDAYYVVVEGELSVTVDGSLRGHTLNPGDGFGEISLLHHVPRTATITALSDCRMLMVGSAQFLASVTSSVDGQALATEVSAGRLTADARRLARLGGSGPDAAAPSRRNDPDT